MSTTTIPALIEELRRLPSDFTNNVKQCAEEAAWPALELTITEFLKPVPDKFREIVQGFYDNYPAPSYSDERRYSMFDVFRTELVKKGNNRIGIIEEYDDSDMTFRDGGTGLYDLAFKKGYHGGAKSSKPDKRGKVVSGYHYRYPRMEGKDYVAYPYWGDAAAREKESPYNQFRKWIDEYWESPKLQTLINKYFDQEFEKVLNRKLSF